MGIKKAQFVSKNKDKLVQAQCILMGISMKQTHQSGDELNAFVHEINSYPNIKKVILVITDYLHRHYVQLEGDKSKEQAGIDAEKMGEEWLKENSAILEKIPSEKLQIIKWKTLIDDSFKVDLLKVEECYSSNDSFKKLVSDHSEKYGNKQFDQLKSKGSKDVELKDCILAAKNYFLEESAIISKFVSLKFDVMTYPGECNAGINFIYKELFKKDLNFIAYRFRSTYKFLTDSTKNQQEKNSHESYQPKQNI